MPKLWQLLLVLIQAYCFALLCFQGRSVLTTKKALKIPLSNLADGQSGVLQGVIKLNYFEGVLRKNFENNPGVQASFLQC